MTQDIYCRAKKSLGLFEHLACKIVRNKLLKIIFKNVRSQSFFFTSLIILNTD